MRFSWSVENGSRDCPVGSDRQPRAPRNGLRGSRYRPRQRLSALGGNEHKIKPRAQSRDLLCGFDCGHDVGEHGLYTAQDSSAYWQFEYCVPNWRLSGALSKNSEATQESRDLIGCLPTLTPIIHPTSGGLTLCELIKRYKEDPSRRSLTDKTRDT